MNKDPKTFQDHQDSTNENKSDEPNKKKEISEPTTQKKKSKRPNSSKNKEVLLIYEKPMISINGKKGIL